MRRFKAIYLLIILAVLWVGAGVAGWFLLISPQKELYKKAEESWSTAKGTADSAFNAATSSKNDYATNAKKILDDHQKFVEIQKTMPDIYDLKDTYPSGMEKAALYYLYNIMSEDKPGHNKLVKELQAWTKKFPLLKNKPAYKFDGTLGYYDTLTGVRSVLVPFGPQKLTAYGFDDLLDKISHGYGYGHCPYFITPPGKEVTAGASSGGAAPAGGAPAGGAPAGGAPAGGAPAGGAPGGGAPGGLPGGGKVVGMPGAAGGPGGPGGPPGAPRPQMIMQMQAGPGGMPGGAPGALPGGGKVVGMPGVAGGPGGGGMPGGGAPGAMPGKAPAGMPSGAPGGASGDATGGTAATAGSGSFTITVNDEDSRYNPGRPMLTMEYNASGLFITKGWDPLSTVIGGQTMQEYLTSLNGYITAPPPAPQKTNQTETFPLIFGFFGKQPE